MSVSIRRAAPNDYLAVESIENAADQLLIDRLSPDRWEPAPSGLSRAAAPGFVVVAEEMETGTIVGFVHVLEADGIAHLEQLSVLPQMGQRGYGRTLLNTAMDEARRRGYERSTLRTCAAEPAGASATSFGTIRSSTCHVFRRSSLRRPPRCSWRHAPVRRSPANRRRRLLHPVQQRRQSWLLASNRHSRSRVIAIPWSLKRRSKTWSART